MYCAVKIFCLLSFSLFFYFSFCLFVFGVSVSDYLKLQKEGNVDYQRAYWFRRLIIRKKYQPSVFISVAFVISTVDLELPRWSVS